MCTQTTLGIEPATNAGLAADCDTQPAVQATLRRRGAELEREHAADELEG